MKKATILGAVIGDTIGSIYEFRPTKDYNFNILNDRMEYTDDSIMTLAVAKWILTDPSHKPQILTDIMQALGRKYPHPVGGYGGMFQGWLFKEDPRPYNSWGNGSAMRVSPVGFAFDSMEETLRVAEISAAVTHNHPEGIKGAKATAAAIYLARTGTTKEYIQDYIYNEFDYDVYWKYDEIKPRYRFDGSCQGTVPQSIIAFLESENYEDAIRKTIALGGDADTMGAITGAIAAAFYKEVPDDLYDFTVDKLPDDLKAIAMDFEQFVKENQTAQQ